MPAQALTGSTFFFPWEVSLMEWLQATLPESVIRVISVFSMFGEELLMVAVLGFLYWCWDKQTGRRIGLSVLMVNIWNPMIKNAALRRRPYFDHEGIRILRVVEPSADPLDIAAQGYSFPSGHSANASSLFGSVAASLRRKALTVIAVVIAVLVGFSRVTVGAHYPTDVLCGWALGLFAVFFVPWLEKKLHSTLALYGLLLLTGIPGFFFCRSADFYTGFGLLAGFMAGTLVEEKYVRFENTRSPLRCILRVAVGAGLFLGVNSLLKMPFSKEFLNSGTAPALLVRCARYALVAFLGFGVYPIAFRYTAKIGGVKA